MRRTAQVLAAVLGVLLLALGPGVGPAAAHDALIESDPPDGAVLDAAPGSLVLTFSSAQLDVGAAVAVTGPDGSVWADGAPVVDGPTVTQALVPQMPSGAYAVEWRSVSADGHPISGSLSFTLAVPEPVATPTPTPTATAAEAAAGSEADGSTEPAAGAEEPDDAAESVQRSTGVLGSRWIAAALALAVVAGLVTTIVLRRRASNGHGDPRAPQDQEGQRG